MLGIALRGPNDGSANALSGLWKDIAGRRQTRWKNGTLSELQLASFGADSGCAAVQDRTVGESGKPTPPIINTYSDFFSAANAPTFP